MIWNGEQILTARLTSEQLDEHSSKDSNIIGVVDNPLLHIAVDWPAEQFTCKSQMQTLYLRKESRMLKTFLDHPGANANAVGSAGFATFFVVIYDGAVQATGALLGHRMIDINLMIRADHAFSFTIHRIYFHPYESQHKYLTLNASAAEQRRTLCHLTEILQMLLEHPKVEVDATDAKGYAAVDWLSFYRNISDDEEATVVIDPDHRDWVVSTGREIAGQVLELLRETHHLLFTCRLFP